MRKIIAGETSDITITIIKNGVKTDPYSIPYVQIEDSSDGSLVELFDSSKIEKIDIGEYKISFDTKLTTDSMSITAETVGVGDGETVKFTLDNYPADTYTIFVNGSEVSTSEYRINNYTGELWFNTAPLNNFSITANYNVDSTNESLSDGLYDDKWTVIFDEGDVPEQISQQFQIISDEWNSYDFLDNLDIIYTIRTKTVSRGSIDRMLFNISVSSDEVNNDIVFKNGTISIYDINGNSFIEDAEIELNGSDIYYNFDAKYVTGNYYATITLSFADEKFVSQKMYFKII